MQSLRGRIGGLRMRRRRNEGNANNGSDANESGILHTYNYILYNV